MTSVALVLLLKQIFLRPWPASYNWILNDLLRTAICSFSQGRNEVYFFVADPVFLRKFLIPDPKSDENFDPWSHKI